MQRPHVHYIDFKHLTHVDGVSVLLFKFYFLLYCSFVCCAINLIDNSRSNATSNEKITQNKKKMIVCMSFFSTEKIFQHESHKLASSSFFLILGDNTKFYIFWSNFFFLHFFFCKPQKTEFFISQFKPLIAYIRFKIRYLILTWKNKTKSSTHEKKFRVFRCRNDIKKQTRMKNYYKKYKLYCC